MVDAEFFKLHITKTEDNVVVTDNLTPASAIRSADIIINNVKTDQPVYERNYDIFIGVVDGGGPVFETSINGTTIESEGDFIDKIITDALPVDSLTPFNLTAIPFTLTNGKIIYDIFLVSTGTGSATTADILIRTLETEFNQEFFDDLTAILNSSSFYGMDVVQRQTAAKKVVYDIIVAFVPP